MDSKVPIFTTIYNQLLLLPLNSHAFSYLEYEQLVTGWFQHIQLATVSIHSHLENVLLSSILNKFRNDTKA
jgi:hypothetical protein